MKNYLEYKHYLGTVNFDAEAELFYGKLEAINDLVSFEGDSVDSLKNAFYEAVDDYLETCKQLNKEPNKTFKGVFNVRTSQDLHKSLAILASKKKMKLNELVNKSFQFLIDNEDVVLN